MKRVEVHNQAEFDAHRNDPDTVLCISGDATVRAWDNATVTASGNATVRASGDATVRAWDNAIVDAYWNVVIRRYAPSVTVRIHSSRVTIIEPIEIRDNEDWLTFHGFDCAQNLVVLYKRVSSDFRTQEGTSHETKWIPGTIVTHSAWDPAQNECGASKFHAVARPWMADQFRWMKGDRYVAVEIDRSDLYAWRGTPDYPDKIAFRTGRVLYECDRDGNEIKEPSHD